MSGTTLELNSSWGCLLSLPFRNVMMPPKRMNNCRLRSRNSMRSSAKTKNYSKGLVWIWGTWRMNSSSWSQRRIMRSLNTPCTILRLWIELNQHSIVPWRGNKVNALGMSWLIKNRMKLRLLVAFTPRNAKRSKKNNYLTIK